MSTAPRETAATTSPAPKARFVMMGGFLGAGKTTAAGKLAQYLAGRGLRAGLITNDQGRHLADTAVLQSQGFATEEIPGGCFCCRFDALVDAAAKLTGQSRPDVFIAEPVGSCTDLVATVTYPLRRLHGDNFTVAPVSVLVDPIRALRVFGLEKGSAFSEMVLYIYHKQIQEADLVIISKSDLLDASSLEALKSVMEAKFPGKQVLAVSSRRGTNMDAWFARIISEEQAAGKAMDVDYQVYAGGEALLGWLNCTVRLTAGKEFDSNTFLTRMAQDARQRLQARKAEVAHLKMTFSPDAALLGEIAVVNLVRNDFAPELSLKMERPVTAGRLIINLRAEAAPDVLGAVVREALAASAAAFPTMKATLDHLEHFRPGKPSPTHRFETAR